MVLTALKLDVYAFITPLASVNLDCSVAISPFAHPGMEKWRGCLDTEPATSIIKYGKANLVIMPASQREDVFCLT